jgi:hypothetical protein
MNPESVTEYVDRSQALVDADSQMDEQNTKVKIIQPLIDLLGWDLYSTAVELEYGMQVGSGHKKVDYALMLDDTPVVFIEAKGCDSTPDRVTPKSATELHARRGCRVGRAQ